MYIIAKIIAPRITSNEISVRDQFPNDLTVPKNLPKIAKSTDKAETKVLNNLALTKYLPINITIVTIATAASIIYACLFFFFTNNTIFIINNKTNKATNAGTVNPVTALVTSSNKVTPNTADQGINPKIITTNIKSHTNTNGHILVVLLSFAFTTSGI